MNSLARYIRIVEVRGSNPLSSTTQPRRLKSFRGFSHGLTNLSAIHVLFSKKRPAAHSRHVKEVQQGVII